MVVNRSYFNPQVPGTWPRGLRQEPTQTNAHIGMFLLDTDKEAGLRELAELMVILEVNYGSTLVL